MLEQTKRMSSEFLLIYLRWSRSRTFTQAPTKKYRLRLRNTVQDWAVLKLFAEEAAISETETETATAAAGRKQVCCGKRILLIAEPPAGLVQF